MYLHVFQVITEEYSVTTLDTVFRRLYTIHHDEFCKKDFYLQREGVQLMDNMQAEIQEIILEAVCILLQ